MEFLIPSLIAGFLTILAPCSITLLPVMLSGSLGTKNVFKPLIVALSLGVSVFVFTLLLKVSTDLIAIDQKILVVISGLLLVFLGITMVLPELWDRIQVKLGLYKSDQLLEKSSAKGGFLGAILMGAALGPVFSTCSPTYFFILGTILPQDFYVGVLNLVVYSLGLIMMLLAVGYGGRAITSKLKFAANPHGWFKRLLGILLIMVGLIIVTGFDKTLESYILDLGGDDYLLIDIERSLMGR